LLHFLANVMKNKAPELLDWCDELQVCRDAAKMDIPFVLQSFGVVALGLKKCGKVSRELEGTPAADFGSNLNQFTTDATSVLARESGTLKDIMGSYIETNEYYGEDVSLLGHAPEWVDVMTETGQTPPQVGEMSEKCENFFMNVVKFMDLFLSAAKDNEVREKQMMAQARAKQRADEKAARAEGRARAEAIPEGEETPAAAAPAAAAPAVTTPKASPDPAPAAEAAPPEPSPKKTELPAGEGKAVPKKANLQQQIAMKAAAKLKQMKMKKAAAAAAEPGPHITSI